MLYKWHHQDLWFSDLFLRYVLLHLEHAFDGYGIAHSASALDHLLQTTRPARTQSPFHYHEH